MRIIGYGNNRISLVGIVMALYVALVPIHQTLRLGSGGTLNKYLALVLIILLIIKNGIKVEPKLHDILIPIIVFFGLSLIWSSSRNETLSNLITITSHITLLMLASYADWTPKEKRLFLYVLMIACTYYSLQLVVAQSTGVAGAGSAYRSTISAIDGQEADQNMLAVNIGLGAIVALDLYLKEKSKAPKIICLGCAAVIALGIVSTGSRGGLLAFLGGILYTIFHSGMTPKQKKRSAAICLLSVALIIVITSGLTPIRSDVLNRFAMNTVTESDSGRTEIWTKYLTVMLHKPWMAFAGFGSPIATYRDYYGASVATHNDVVNIFISGGLILLFLFIRFIRYVWQKAKSDGNYLGRAMMIAVIVGGFSVDSYTRYGWWLAMLFACISISVENDPKIKQSTEDTE